MERQTSSAVADVILLLRGRVSLFTPPNRVTGFDTFVSNSVQGVDNRALSSAPAPIVIDFSANPLAFRLTAIPAVYAPSVENGRYNMALQSIRQLDAPSMESAIDLVLEPLLLNGAGGISNPIADNAWNSDQDNQAFLAWLDACATAAPDGMSAFRYSLYLLGATKAALGFNAGVTVSAAGGDLVVGLDPLPTSDQTDFERDWLPFYRGAAQHVPVASDQVSASLTATFLVELIAEAIDHWMPATLHAGLDFRLRRKSVTLGGDAVGVTCDIEADLGWVGWTGVGSVSFAGLASIDTATNEAAIDLAPSISVLGIPIPSGWISSRLAAMSVGGFRLWGDENEIHARITIPPPPVAYAPRCEFTSASLAYGHAPGLTFPARRRDDHQA